MLELGLGPVLIVRVAESGMDLLEPRILCLGLVGEHVLDVHPHQLANIHRNAGPAPVALRAELSLSDQVNLVDRADAEREVGEFASLEELDELVVDRGGRTDLDSLLDELENVERPFLVHAKRLGVREHDERLSVRTIVERVDDVAASERLVVLEQDGVVQAFHVSDDEREILERTRRTSDLNFLGAGLGCLLLVAFATAPDLADRARDCRCNTSCRDVLVGHLLGCRRETATGLCQSAADLVDVDLRTFVHRTVELGQELPDLLVPEQHANLPFPLSLSLWGSGIEEHVRHFRTCDPKLPIGDFFVNPLIFHQSLEFFHHWYLL